MSSPNATSSTTQDSDDAQTFHSYRDCSEQDILNDIRNLKSVGIHYATIDNIASQCEFVFNKTIKGEILLEKTSQKEFILSGVFEIDARRYFMTSDGKWNVNNSFNTHFRQVKPSCNLISPQRNTDIHFSQNDFPTIIGNIRAIENLANPRKSRDAHSLIIEEPGQPPAIRLTHHLFIVRPLIDINIDISTSLTCSN